MITTFVQSLPSRPEHEATFASIRASDIGDDFHRTIQKDGETAREHFLRLMGEMAKADTPYVLRLEDDIAVNRSILHNCRSCPYLDHPRFGALWLWCPLDRPVEGLWDRSEIHGSLGVLLPTESIPRLIPRVEKWFADHDRRLSQDIALSRAVWLSERRVFLHQPALVDHHSEKSTIGNDGNPAIRIGQGFDEEWRRG